MLTELLWQSALVAIVLWWTYWLSRYVVGAIERLLQTQDDDFLNSSYPVFCKRTIRETHNSAIRASKELQRVEASVLEDSKFKEASQQHSIPKDISESMLNVTRALVDAEKHWHRHSAMMDANMAVLAGKMSREEALAAAMKCLELTNSITTVLDAIALRDQWKDRLEGRRIEDPSPRPYSNPWQKRGRTNT